jgi:murein L,D-transpeptidase YcbB/YkuD
LRFGRNFADHAGISANESKRAAAPDDVVGQAIQTVLEPLQSSFPPLLTSRKHQRVDVGRVVMDFYSHRNYRAAWTDGRDVTQLLKSLSDTQVDGLVPEDFPHSADLTQAQLAMQATAPTAGAVGGFRSRRLTRTYITALLQLRRGKVDPARLDFHWNFDPVGG